MKVLPLLLALLLASAPGWARPDSTRMDLTPQELQKLNSESDRRWTSVHWAASPAQAVSQAQAAHKPILIFLVVSEYGNSSSCQV